MHLRMQGSSTCWFGSTRTTQLSLQDTVLFCQSLISYLQCRLDAACVEGMDCIQCSVCSPGAADCHSTCGSNAEPHLAVISIIQNQSTRSIIGSYISTSSYMSNSDKRMSSSPHNRRTSKCSSTTSAGGSLLQACR